jgi:hypothetical protein
MTVAALAGLVACQAPRPIVDDAAIETAVSAGGERALALGRRGLLAAEGVTVDVGVTDAYGSKSQVGALALRWNADDLARVNWKEISKYRLLDLARPVILDRNGAQALGYWCVSGEGEGRTLTPVLCGEPYRQAAAAFMSGAKPSS